MTNRILLLSACFWLMCSNLSFSQELEAKISDGKVTIVEEMPQYPGGNDALLKYISRELRYPQECRKNGLIGVVFVTYSISASGDIENAFVSFSSNPSFNEEALRVIRSIRGYAPGKQRGKPVGVKFTIPISFVLNDGEEDDRVIRQAIATGYYKIALDERATGTTPSAIHFLDQAIANGKEWFYQGYLTRGDMMLNSGEYLKALNDYNAALGISDTIVSAWQGKGKALMVMNRLDEASSAFQTAIKLRPSAFHALYSLGVIRLTEKRFEEGVTYFTKAIDVDGSSGLSYYSRGMCYARMRNKDDACRDWLKAKDLGSQEAITVAENCSE